MVLNSDINLVNYKHEGIPLKLSHILKDKVRDLKSIADKISF
jgi:hypothetical protein